MSRLFIALVVLGLVPAAAYAELNLTGGNQFINAVGGDNQFGNLSGDYRSFNSSTINGFPSSGSGSPAAVAASASLNFMYTQTGDEANFTQSITQYQGGVEYGLAEHRFTIEFTALNNVNFAFTSNYNGLTTVGAPKYFVTLMDLTTLGTVFVDNSQDPADLNPVENHYGILLAGHNYSLNGTSQLYAGVAGTGVAASATGTYVFTTSAISAVPEPSSLMLLGASAAFLIRRRYARR
jgi:hypothetical protein